MLVVDADLVEDEGEVEGRFAEGVVAPRGAAVARRHVGLEEERALVGLQRPELRHVLRGLPVHDLAVVEGGLDEHGGVRLPRQVRVGAVRLEVVVLVLLLGVPPLLELADREDRKSTRLNSSHEWTSYAVFCLKKKKNTTSLLIPGTAQKSETRSEKPIYG